MNFIPHMRLPRAGDRFSSCLITDVFSRQLFFHDPKNYTTHRIHSNVGYLQSQT